jgi:photosystem II stability/assembly factor-like uncharacterized protein
MRTMLLGVIVLAGLLGAGAPRVAMPAAAQESSWTKIYDRPTSEITAVAMFDEMHGAAAAAGGFFYTKDGGATWNAAAFDAPVTLAGPYLGSISYVEPVDAQRGWIAGLSGAVWRTDDAGRSWRVLDTGITQHFNSVTAIDREHLWASANGEGFSDVGPSEVPPSSLLHSDDGGDTWTNARPVPGYGVFLQVEFADADDGWLVAQACQPGAPIQSCTAEPELLRTRDGGDTWHVVEPPAEGLRLVRVQLVGGAGYATFARDCNMPDGCTSDLYRTNDLGETWRKSAAPPGDINSFQFFGAGHGFASQNCRDGDCDIVETTDGGTTWRTLAAETIARYGTPFALTPTHVLVLGGGTGLLRIGLNDGAVTSPAVPVGPAFWDVAFDPRSATRGWATAHRAFYRTEDGGRSWTEAAAPAQFGELHAGSDGSVWARVDGGACDGCSSVYRSTDGGASWQATAAGAWLYTSSMQAADASRAWVVADNGLWRTDDGGASWRMVEDGNSAMDFHVIDRDHAWTRTCGIFTCVESFRYSSDGGETWETRPLPVSDGLTFVTREVGFAMKYENQSCPATCSFTLIGTIDGGRTWRDLYRSSLSLSNFAFVDALHGWAAAQDGISGASSIVGTNDGGRTWTRETELPGGVYSPGNGILIHGDRATVRLQVGGGVLPASRMIMFERTLDRAVNPIVLPDTGRGRDSPAGATETVAGAAALLLLGAGIISHRTRRRTGCEARRGHIR